MELVFMEKQEEVKIKNKFRVIDYPFYFKFYGKILF